MLSDMPKTALIVPCYNEAARLDFDSYSTTLDNYPFLRLYFVDDGSSDGTRSLLENFAAAHSGRVEVIKLALNSGKAAAVRNGILAGIAAGFELVGYWDADLSTPTAELERFIKCFKRSNVQIVMGCRLRRLGADVRRSTMRHYFGRCFATAASLLLRLPVYDTQCGAKIMRATLAVKLFNSDFDSDWLFDVELLKRYRDASGIEACRNEIVELPLLSWQDVAGSKLSLVKMLSAPFMLIKIFIR